MSAGLSPAIATLVKERLKQMMVPLIDQCDFDVADSANSPGRMDAGESASDNDDPFHAISLRDIMARMIRNADASDLPAIVDIYNAAIPGGSQRRTLSRYLWRHANPGFRTAISRDTRSGFSRMRARINGSRDG
jgi:hypothetical protein